MKYQILFLVFIFFAFIESINAQLIVKDQDPLQHMLFQINDEGLGGSVTIPSLKAITDPSMKLYNLLGTLYWNGNVIGSGGASNLNDLTDAKYDGSSLFLGEGAGENDDASSNANTALGINSLYSNTSGYQNTANGYYGLKSNTSGNNNTANGYEALSSNTIGWSNTANGCSALNSNISGWYNTANGYQALFSNTAWSNTANGHVSLYSNTTGESNTAHGAYALYQNKTGSYNTAVGYSSDVTSDNLSNTTALGYDAHVGASDQVRIGNDNVNKIGGAVTWSTYSDGRYKRNVEENIPGLSFVLGLRPITYNLNTVALANRRENKTIIDESGNLVDTRNTPAEIESRQRKASIKYSGFIAQEVETLSKKLNYDFSGIHVPKNEDGTYSLSYAEFVVPLVKAVQEQQEIIESLTKRITELEKGVNLRR